MRGRCARPFHRVNLNRPVETFQINFPQRPEREPLPQAEFRHR